MPFTTWARIDGGAGTLVSSGGNIKSVTRTGVGTYQVTFTYKPASNQKFGCVATPQTAHFGANIAHNLDGSGYARADVRTFDSAGVDTDANFTIFMGAE